MAEQVNIENTGEQIILEFQSFFDPEDISGTVKFYRPSDKKSDLIFEIKADSMRQQIFSTDLLQDGKYILQIDYKIGDKAYFQQGPVFINIF